jgi:hypothetical protein
MPNSSKPFGDLQSVNRTDSVSRLREDWRVARVAYSDLEMIRVPRANVLLRGAEGVVQNVLDMLMPTLRTPVDIWRPGERLRLPAVAQTGTIILREIGRLTTDDQSELLVWLDEAVGRTQVVSTTAWPLLSRVHSGGFIDTLYYRLNTVYVNLTA